MANVKLGDRVKDTISGFKGIMVSHAKHLHGCDTIGVKPEVLHDGQPIECQWFDILRMELVEERYSEVVPKGEGVG